MAKFFKKVSLKKDKTSTATANDNANGPSRSTKNHKKKSGRFNSIDCTRANRGDDASEVNMVEIQQLYANNKKDLAAGGAMTSSQQQQNAQNASRKANKTMSMMTPDMLETLGLTEFSQVVQPYQYRGVDKTNKKTTKNVIFSDGTAPAKGHPPTELLIGSPRDRARTTRERRQQHKNHSNSPSASRETRQQNSSRNNKRQTSKSNMKPSIKTTQRYSAAGTGTGTASANYHPGDKSAMYFADSETNTMSSDSTASTDVSSVEEESHYEAEMPRDPCPCHEDWTFVTGSGEPEEEDDDFTYATGEYTYTTEGDSTYYTTETSSQNYLQQYYREMPTTIQDPADPVACASLVLTMPVACGLLCVDNLMDTNFFDAATTGYKNSNSSSLEQLCSQEEPETESVIPTSLEEPRREYVAATH